MARVLVVDDDDDVRTVLHDWLVRDGHAVYLAAGVGEALDLMASVVPDVLLTDFGMAPRTGDELLRAVAARHPMVGRILHTGSFDDEARSACEAAHVVVRKGCEMREISEAVRRCLERAQAC